jgi:protein-disulfide isomerase
MIVIHKANDQELAVKSDPGAAVLGVANPDVTVVEYFDYNCPYCRKLAPSVHASRQQ